MIDPDGATFGGTNDVVFTWDGTKKTSVECPQISNATIGSTCPFFGITWAAHDVAIYGPGTYTVYDGCPAGCPSCGIGTPISFTVGAGELGVHMLINWGGNNDIDVVNVWTPNAVFAPSAMWTGPCGANPADEVWNLMSKDWNGDGINGYPFVDGPFVGFNANFNVRIPVCGGCAPGDCNDNNACTSDVCDCGGVCIHTPISCDDNNICTIDMCNPAIGCVFTSKNCNDNNTCTTDTCNPATGCVHTPVPDGTGCIDNCPVYSSCQIGGGICLEGRCVCNPPCCDDNNACTVDTFNAATGCFYTPITCNDNNACTTDSCNPATGCVYTPMSVSDNDLCTIDTCNPATGAVFTPKNCADQNLCTDDSCDPATGACVFAPKCPSCATCDPAVGICSPCCPEGSVKSLITRGGGQNPNTVDLQIQTAFTVLNDGCISGSSASTVTCTPGTVMLVNVKAGQGPQPTSCTWNGVSLGGDYSFTITCPDFSGDVGKLICDNKDSAGKDIDRITVSVQ
jgi:hypothetical protein